MLSVRAVIFTDMDGTLLDHADYSWAPAKGALKRCEREGVVVVPTSSKTRAELMLWLKKLSLQAPIISENGAGAFPGTLTDGRELFTDELGCEAAKVFCVPIQKVRAAIEELRSRIPGKLINFGQMDLQEIIEHTGLPENEAQLAAERDFDEPFLWEPEPDPEELSEVSMHFAEHGLVMTRGGRFWHLMGGCDKSVAVRWMKKNLFAPGTPTLALGDAPNDMGMLAAVDKGILMDEDDRGPKRWAREVLLWLDELKEKK
ncbi:MAG: hypothetical protein C0608_05880 [Deltaproteobacteria bacterium]|nr:MAG: hypothetical protein C0608_05880 [Deltaproteobacteria bacterium]